MSHGQWNMRPVVVSVHIMLFGSAQHFMSPNAGEPRHGTAWATAKQRENAGNSVESTFAPNVDNIVLCTGD